MTDTNSNTIGIVYLAALGALIATLCDKVHVLTHTLSYPDPEYWDQPWWSYPAFFVAFLVMGFSYVQMVKLLPAGIDRSHSTSKCELKDFINSMLLFAFVYLMSGFGNEYPMLLNALFYGTFLLRLAFSTDKSFMLILSVLMGIGGAVAEGTMSAFELVYYTDPDIYHVPAWLSGLYLHGAFALRDGMRVFVYRK